MSPPRGALVVMAKAPEPGAVKTRMTPPLSPQQAAALYACLLDDVLDVSLAGAVACGLAPLLALHPASACAAFARRRPAFRVIAQRGADLGERMEHAIDAARAAGAERVLLRGSDSPTLDGAVLADALRRLSSHDLVLCPDRDGGYSLVGVRASARGLFAHPMSTGRVLEDTLDAARRRGWRGFVQPPRFDLDRIEDLRWLAEARDQGAASLCPRTLSYLDAEQLWRYVRADARPDGAASGGSR
jgi:uncharacterized protein